MSDVQRPAEDRPRAVFRDDDGDDISDAEIVEDGDDVLSATADSARADQDAASDRAAVEGDRGRAASELADILEDDLMTVEQLDDAGEAVSVLEPGGRMLDVESAGASVGVTHVGERTAAGAPGGLASASGSGPVGPDAHGQETEIECPGCGLTCVGTDPRPSAEWFCPRCDYPLFLVRKPAAPAPDGATRGARRRLPGTSGRAVIAAGACWNCGEWNEAGVAACLRCAATLPKPLPPDPGPFETFEVPEPELVEVEVMYWPPVWIAALGGFGSGMVFLWAVLTAMGRL